MPAALPRSRRLKHRPNERRVGQRASKLRATCVQDVKMRLCPRGHDHPTQFLNRARSMSMNAVGNILQSQNVRVLDMTAYFPVVVLGLATRPNSHIWISILGRCRHPCSLDAPATGWKSKCSASCDAQANNLLRPMATPRRGQPALLVEASPTHATMSMEERDTSLECCTTHSLCLSHS